MIAQSIGRSGFGGTLLVQQPASDAGRQPASSRIDAVCPAFLAGEKQAARGNRLVDKARPLFMLNWLTRGVEAGASPARSRRCNWPVLRRRAESQTPLVVG
jgi:hypothetical protein